MLLSELWIIWNLTWNHQWHQRRYGKYNNHFCEVKASHFHSLWFQTKELIVTVSMKSLSVNEMIVRNITWVHCESGKHLPVTIYSDGEIEIERQSRNKNVFESLQLLFWLMSLLIRSKIKGTAFIIETTDL